MYSKMPTKRKISIFFGFGWPSIGLLYFKQIKSGPLFTKLFGIDDSVVLSLNKLSRYPY